MTKITTENKPQTLPINTFSTEELQGRIFNDDSLNVLHRTPSDSIDIIHIDPPFKVHATGKSNALKDEAYLDEIAPMSDGITEEYLDEMVRVLKKDNFRMFIWCSKDQLDFYFTYFKDYAIDILFWHKSNPIPFSAHNTYLSSYELLLFITNKENAGKIYKYLDTDNWVTPINSSDKKKYGHPTIKPQFIVEELLAAVAKPNELVADYFLGSGTTVSAAISLGLNYTGVELSEEYFQVAEKRIAEALESNSECTSGYTIDNKVTIYNDAAVNKLENLSGEFSLALMDITSEESIPIALFNKLASAMDRPNLYVHTKKHLLPAILDYFLPKKFTFDLLAVHKDEDTELVVFLRRGGNKLNGEYKTKGKRYLYSQLEEKLTGNKLPTALIENIIINSSNEGTTILDCTTYSSQIAEVCLSLGRKYIGFTEDVCTFGECIDTLSLEEEKVEVTDMETTGTNIFSLGSSVVFGDPQHTDKCSPLLFEDVLLGEFVLQVRHDEHGRFSGIEAVHLGFFDEIDDYEWESVNSISIPSAQKLVLTSLSDLLCSQTNDDTVNVLFSAHNEAEPGFLRLKSLQNRQIGVIFNNTGSGKFKVSALRDNGKIIAFNIFC